MRAGTVDADPRLCAGTGALCVSALRPLLIYVGHTTPPAEWTLGLVHRF